jgi:hypothetical protein
MQIEVMRIVAARPAAVFATVADVPHWPHHISSVTSIELLTPGRVHVGTRLRAGRIMFGHAATEELEVLEMEKPRRFRLAAESRDLHYERDHLIDALDAGVRLTLILRTRPGSTTEKAALPFFGPYMDVNVRDELERDLVEFAAAATVRSGERRRTAISRSRSA